MFKFLDAMSVVFWSIAYVLMIIAGKRNKPRSPKAKVSSKAKAKDKVKTTYISMPYIPGVLNFSWETCAMIKLNGFWGHILWSGLYLVIFCQNYKHIKTKKNKIIYIVSAIVLFVLFFYIFNISSGMLLSSYILDIIVIICYLIYKDKIATDFKISIAASRLIGDLSAGIAYYKESNVVAVIAAMVLICNATYLALCIKDRTSAKNIKQKRCN